MNDPLPPRTRRNGLKLIIWIDTLIVLVVISYIYAFGLIWPWNILDNVKFGGDFLLTDQHGQPVTDEDLLGNPHAIFFGFTHCPEICPTTLYEASGWLKKLGPDGDKLKIWFVTVDPERDTPEVLNNYMANFDPRIRAITGTPEKVFPMLADYKIYYKKVPGKGDDYTMDHTASVLLFNAEGSFAKTISWGEDGSVALQKLKDLIAGNS